MSRKLEKFIGDNRNEFDDAQPSGKVWENIAAGFEMKPARRARFMPLYKWSIAASVLLVVSVAAYFVITSRRSSAGTETTVKKDIPSGGDTLAADYAPEVNEFIKLVALKQEELKALAPEQPELYNQFTKDIDQLDSSYRTLKNQLGISPNREVLIEAMIQNLQLQLNVLNQQLNIINQIKESKKHNHEKEVKSV